MKFAHARNKLWHSAGQQVLDKAFLLGHMPPLLCGACTPQIVDECACCVFGDMILSGPILWGHGHLLHCGDISFSSRRFWGHILSVILYASFGLLLWGMCSRTSSTFFGHMPPLASDFGTCALLRLGAYVSPNPESWGHMGLSASSPVIGDPLPEGGRLSVIYCKPFIFREHEIFAIFVN